MVLSWK